MRYLLPLIFVVWVIPTNAQTVLGKWKSIDDQTGQERSIVELTEKDGKVNGRIIEIIYGPGDELDPICSDCEDDRKNQPMLGMEIIRDMELDGEEWEEGTICDPETGKVYDCKIWLDSKNPDILNVRGYLYFIYRTQQWFRIKD